MKIWQCRVFSSKFELKKCGLNAILPAYKEFFKFQKQIVSNVESTAPESAKSTSSNQFFSSNHGGLFYDSETERPSDEVQCEEQQLESEINAEIKIYNDFIKFNKNVDGVSSSKEFWLSRNDLPRLRQLFVILENIGASSAPLERFFSITGIINSARMQNMNDDLLINKSLLKANIKILSEIKA